MKTNIAAARTKRGSSFAKVCSGGTNDHHTRTPETSGHYTARSPSNPRTKEHGGIEKNPGKRSDYGPQQVLKRACDERQEQCGSDAHGSMGPS
jgi:hypothetical protein